ncbi:beta-ketoacyl synthase N-terminal-like domain-containing protein, partial [Paenibacillus ihuae]
MSHRVVVTGMGVITSLGKDLDTFWDNLMHGKSGVSLVEAFDVSEYTTRIAASVTDFDPEERFGRKEARKMDRFVQFAVAAGEDALKDSGLKIGEDIDPERIGVSVGSGI